MLFFPNYKQTTYKKIAVSNFEKIILTGIKPLEKIAYILQKAYMHAISGETVSHTKAFFHPRDNQGIILDMLEIRFDRYKRLFK